MTEVKGGAVRYLILGLVSLWVNAALQAHDREAPAVFAEPRSLDFGSHVSWIPRIGVFTLHNLSDTPVEVDTVRKSCGCLQIRTSSKRIEPDGTTVVTATIEAGELRGAYTKHIFVHLSGSPEPIRLTLRGKALTLVKVRPGFKVKVGKLAQGENLDIGIAVEPGTAEMTVGIGKPMTPPGVRCSLPAKGDERQDIVTEENPLHLSIKGKAPAGRFRWKIRVPILSPADHPPLEILVYGEGVAPPG